MQSLSFLTESFLTGSTVTGANAGAKAGAWRRAALLFGLLPALLLLTLFVGSAPDAAAQTTRTVTLSYDGAGPPAGYTYPTIDEGAGASGARRFRLTLDSAAPAGGIDVGSPGTAPNGNSQVESTLIAEGQTSIAFSVFPNDNNVDSANYAYVQRYPNTPNTPGVTFTVVPADRFALLTVVDNDPTVVTLDKLPDEPSQLDEGQKVRFQVVLSRPLVGAGDHGPAEVIAVPLRIDQTAAAVTTSDWSITLDADSPNTGVSLGLPVVGSGEAFAHQVVTFSGAGAQTAVLEVAAELDDLNQELDEAITISLASNAEFDGPTHGSATNVGGGADPRATGSPPQTDRFSLTIRNVENVVVVPDDWALIPSGVQPGGKFRLLFITTSFIPATSGDIATYDAHVRGQAAAGHTAIRPYAQKFRAVGSTASVSARNHAGLTGGGVPIYWLNGPQVAPNYAGFWSDRWQNWLQPDRRTQWGNPDSHSDWPWTGTATDGSSHANHLGHATHARRGRFSVGPSTTGPISDNNAPVSQSHSLYGISPVFQVAVDAPFDVNYKRLYEGERKTIVVSGLGLTEGMVSVSVDPAPSDSEYKIYYPAGGSAAVSSGSFDAAVTNRIARFDIQAITDTVEDEMELELEFTQSGERVGKAVIQIRDGSRGGSILFRTCPNGGCLPETDLGWVESDRPLVQLVEGGGTVTYQYKLIGHMDQDEAFGEASVRIEDTRKKGPHNVGAGLADWDRIQCHRTEDHGTMTPLGGSSSYVVTSTNYVSTTQWHDLFGGCPYHANGISWPERNDWQTVTYSAGHDADAYDEAIVLEHKVRTTAPGSGYVYDGPPGQEGIGPTQQRKITPRTFGSGYVELRIVDDDDWDQEFLYSGDGGVTWTKASDGGLREAIPDELEAGATHDVHIKLLNPSLAEHRGRDYIYVKVGGCGDRFIDPPCDIGVSPNSYGTDRPSSSTDFDWGTGLDVNAAANAPVRLRLHVREDAAPGTRKALTFWNYDWLRRTDTDLPDPSVRQPGPNRNTASRYISGMLYEETRVVEVVPATAKQVVALPPTLTIASAATSVTEGDDVTFTITADPAPQFDVTVNLAADEEMGSGIDLVASSQLTTIIIPAHQSTASWTITTYSDEVNRADGTVVGRIMPGEGYTVGAPSSVTLTLVDDDPLVADNIVGGAPGDPPPPTYTADPQVIAAVQALASQTQHGEAHVNRWLRALAALGGIHPDGVTGGALTLAEARGMADTYNTPVWNQVVAELEAKAAFEAAQQTTPAVNLTAATGGTEGSNVTFTLSANPAPAADLAVSVTVVTSGDYGVTAGPRTVTISGGSTTKTLTWPTTDDSSDEDDGFVMLTVNSGSDYTVGPLSAGIALVRDNDDGAPEQQSPPQPPPTPEVNVTSAAGGTEGSNVTFTVSANPAPTADLAVSATVATVGDYGVTAGSRTVTIAGGTASATLTLPTTDDSTDEADGSVTLTLNGGSGYTVGQFSSETVQVQDDDDAQQQQPATYTVDPALIAEVQAHIDAFTARNHAAGVRDWNLILDRLEGRTGMSDAKIAAWLADSKRHGWQDGIVTLPKVQAALAAMAAQQTQQTPPPTPEVNITSAAGGTEGSNVTFTVSANPAPTADLAVSATVATVGDYGVTAGSRTVTIAGGTASATLTLPTTDDSTDEAEGSVTLTLNGGSGYTVGQLSSETAQVQDDDDPPPQQQQQPVVIPVVSVTGGSGVTEGGDASFTVTANPTPASALPVSVTVTASGDYGATTGARTVSIPTGGSATFTVATTNDGNDEADGSVTATVNAGNGYTVSSSQGAATVGVADDDVPVVSISGGNGVTEGGDASFTITASPVPAADLTVSVTVTASGDYGATTGQRTVTVPTTGSAVLTVGTTDDGNDESDGSVTATVNAGDGYAVSSSQGVATVSVSDDDDAPPVVTPVVSISGGSGVTEGGNASFTITASPVPAADLTVNVTVTASGDYGATTGQRTVTVPTTGSAVLTVGTTDDSADEADGSVTATLVDGADYDLGTNQAATVSVADDDVPVVSISGGSGVTEGGDASFTITASPVPAADLSVSVTVSASGDYGATTGSRTVTVPTTGSAVLTVGTTDDSADEADGSVTATLVDGADYDLGTNQAATVSVADDDAPTSETAVTISIEDASASENDTDLVFRVTLSEASNEDVTVQWATSHSQSPDRARGGQGYDYDFWHARGEIVIRAGETSGTGAVWLNQDSKDEPDEVFTVTLSSPVGATLEREEGTMTIIDDD